MLISGFTILRNGVKFAYPFIESIASALPICDEFIVNLGVPGDDDTKGALLAWRATLPEQDASKIKIFESDWKLDDPERRQGGRILAEQTNLALNRCGGDWCLYLQADEVLHEKDLPRIRSATKAWNSDPRVDAFVLPYLHFYGNYQVIQTSRSSYRREIRVVRNFRSIESTGDAQGFRYRGGAKIPALLCDAPVYHYGWVRPPETMREKTGFMDTLYHPEATANVPVTGANHEYKRIVGLRTFEGTHPAVMMDRVSRSVPFDFSRAPRAFSVKDLWKVLSGLIEKWTGIRLFEYRNYVLLKIDPK